MGFGLTHGTVMYGSVLANAYGPGTLFAPACPSVSLFLLSGTSSPSFSPRLSGDGDGNAFLYAAVFALAFIAMHVLLSVLSFDAFKMTEWKSFLIKTGVMLGGHLVISFLVRCFVLFFFYLLILF
jgi:hypothetical protein